MTVSVSALGAIVALVVAIGLILRKVPPVYGMMAGALIGGLIGCKPPPPFASNDTTFYKLTLFPRQNLLHLSACKHITCRLLFWLNLCLKSQLSQTSKAYCLHMQSDNSAAP